MLQGALPLAFRLTRSAAPCFYPEHCSEETLHMWIFDFVVTSPGSTWSGVPDCSTRKRHVSSPTYGDADLSGIACGISLLIPMGSS